MSGYSVYVLWCDKDFGCQPDIACVAMISLGNSTLFSFSRCFRPEHVRGHGGLHPDEVREPQQAQGPEGGLHPLHLRHRHQQHRIRLRRRHGRHHQEQPQRLRPILMMEDREAKKDRHWERDSPCCAYWNCSQLRYTSVLYAMPLSLLSCKRKCRCGVVKDWRGERELRIIAIDCVKRAARVLCTCSEQPSSTVSRVSEINGLNPKVQLISSSAAFLGSIL